MDPAAAAFVRDALDSRVCFVRAPAGWGKTTAVRAALGDAPHRWVDLGHAPLEDLEELLDDAGTGRLVLDDAQAIARDPHALELVRLLVESRPELRVVVLAREELELPIATWIAEGIAALPISQSDLALDAEQIRALLADSNLRSDDATVNTVMRCTGGWPVAVRFSLMALRRTAELARVEAISRELACKYLAEQVVFDLDDDRRNLLRDLAIAGPFDERRFEWIGRAGIPLHHSPHQTRLHDVLSAFLLSQMSPEERATRAIRIAEAIARDGSAGEALEIVRAHAAPALEAFLETHGLALLRSGRRDSLKGAIATLPSAVRRDRPLILMIRAALEYGDGNFERAKELADRAIERTDPGTPLFVELMRYRATLNCYEPREQAVAWLERVTSSASPATLREIRGPVAILLAMLGDTQRARADIAAVIADAEAAGDDAMLRAALTWAMSIEVNAGDADRVAEFAYRAMDLHERSGDLRGIAIVRNTLAGAAIVLGDDREEARRQAIAYRDAATRWGDAANVKTAAAYLYQNAVERGDEATIAQVESVLLDADASFPGVHVYRTARAIRLGAGGDFAAGARLMDRLSARMGDAIERRNIHATVALFLALDGQTRAAAERLRHLDRRHRPQNAIAEREQRIADVYAGFAEVFVGHHAAAKRRFPTPVRADERALVEAGLELVRLGAHAMIAAARPILERLANSGNAGFARLLHAAISARGEHATQYGLTEAELRVLRDLAAGRSPHHIAGDSHRSVETVRNQIKAAIRKLGVSGRLEAVAAARNAGLL